MSQVPNNFSGLREPASVGRSSSRPRIGVFSIRQLEKQVWRSSIYEFEDAIAEGEGVEIIEAQGVESESNRFRDRLWRHTNRWLRAELNFKPWHRPVPFNGHYDLLVYLCQREDDMRYLRAIPNWRKHCSMAVCWLDEFWAVKCRKYPGQLELLSGFDKIFMGFSTSVPELQQYTSVPCSHLPVGADCRTFNPFPMNVPRSIDVYSMGRRAPRTHYMLLETARQNNLFYLYDAAPLGFVSKPNEHRQLLASLIQRSKLFLVAPAKMTELSHTAGQIEVGTRYFEGAAAGAVMVGTRPELPAFDRDFDWPDAVVPMPHDSDDPTPLIELLNDQDRMRSIRDTNVVNCLRRHDWAYRWRDMLTNVGLPVPRETMARIELLETEASAIERASGGVVSAQRSSRQHESLVSADAI